MIKKPRNLKTKLQPVMTFKEYLLQRELSHKDTFKKSKKLYKSFKKKYDKNS